MFEKFCLFGFFFWHETTAIRFSLVVPSQSAMASNSGTSSRQGIPVLNRASVVLLGSRATTSGEKALFSSRFAAFIWISFTASTARGGSLYAEEA